MESPKQSSLSSMSYNQLTIFKFLRKNLLLLLMSYNLHKPRLLSLPCMSQNLHKHRQLSLPFMSYDFHKSRQLSIPFMSYNHNTVV